MRSGVSAISLAFPLLFPIAASSLAIDGFPMNVGQEFDSSGSKRALGFDWESNPSELSNVAGTHRGWEAELAIHANALSERGLQWIELGDEGLRTSSMNVALVRGLSFEELLARVSRPSALLAETTR